MAYKRKSSLFLMELMIALLIFAVCASVCAAVIAEASADITKSRDISNALIIAQNKAEMIKSGTDNNSGTEYFDAELDLSDEESAVYSSVTTLGEKENGVTQYKIEIFRTADNYLIYDINSAYFCG